MRERAARTRVYDAVRACGAAGSDITNLAWGYGVDATGDRWRGRGSVTKMPCAASAA